MFEIHPKDKNSNEITILSFDELCQLAKQDPYAFESLRIDLCEQLIHHAPESMRKRLKGLQFKIDMERRRSRSAVSTCMKLSEMMNESLLQLSQVLSNPQEYLRANCQHSAEVIPIFGDRKLT